MGKYGKENDRREKRKSKLLTSKTSCWEPPQGETHSQEFVNQIGDFRLVSREVRLASNGMLVEFAFLVQQVVEDKLTELICIDSCNHKNVHRHLQNHTDFTVLKELSFNKDLDEGFVQAQLEVQKYYFDKIGGIQ